MALPPVLVTDIYEKVEREIPRESYGVSIDLQKHLANHGDTSAPAKEIELQVSATHIQWRYKGDTSWINLIALEQLKGAKGDPGVKGDQGAKGDKGEPGQPGTNGFPSEQQWNELVARVAALEAPTP